jgi:hypothetical protein
MADCLIPSEIEKFKKALKEKDITMEELLNASTESLTKKFKPYAGENAGKIALLFERKRILKNKELGIKNAVSKLGEIGRYDPAKKAQIAEDLAKFREAQRERIFNPAETETFYNALADKIVGTHITRAEAQNMFELQSKADKTRNKSFSREKEAWTNPKDQLEYGMQKATLKAFTEELLGDSRSMKELLGARYSEFKQQFKDDKMNALSSVMGDSVTVVRDTAVAMLSSMDNSFALRQGFNALLNNPSAWFKTFKRSWSDIGKTLVGKDLQVKNMIDAEILSRPNNIMGRDAIGGIYGGKEEAFPTSLPARIPLFGRLFKASENAFTGSAIRLRAALFDNFLEVQKKAGADINDVQVIKNAGQLALQMTARSEQGPVGKTILNKYLFWAPRMLKSAFDTLALPVSSKATPFVRKQAAYNLLKYVAAVAVIKASANAIAPGSVEFDPRSTDFKNIKINDTRFSIGMGEMSLITLASRLSPTMHNGEWGFWTKNKYEIYKKFDPNNFGGYSPLDVALGFLMGKASPATARPIIDYLRQEGFAGEEYTLKNQAIGTFTPIVGQAALDLKENNSPEAILSILWDVIGGSSNTYNSLGDDWETSSSKEKIQFKEKVGDEKFKQANDEFNELFKDWFSEVRLKDEYKKQTDEMKTDIISKKKRELKKTIFQKYGFKARKSKKKIVPNL